MLGQEFELVIDIYFSAQFKEIDEWRELSGF